MWYLPFWVYLTRTFFSFSQLNSLFFCSLLGVVFVSLYWTFLKVLYYQALRPVFGAILKEPLNHICGQSKNLCHYQIQQQLGQDTIVSLGYKLCQFGAVLIKNRNIQRQNGDFGSTVPYLTYKKAACICNFS